MGEASSMYRGGEAHTGFWLGNLRKTDHLEEPGIYGIILKWLFKKWDARHGLD
jgi:hypothetical protein